MIEADDEDEANIAALQSRVDSMNTRITVLERDNDLQQSEIAALMNVVNAEEKLGDARDTEGRSQK